MKLNTLKGKTAFWNAFLKHQRLPFSMKGNHGQVITKHKFDLRRFGLDK